jgi:F0F1-type ATP synthase membrane subunit a
MLQSVALNYGGMLAAGDAESHVLPHGIVPILENWNLPVPLGDTLNTFWLTNHLLMLMVAAVLMLLIFIPIGRRYQAVMAGVPVTESAPKGFASLVEGLMDALRSGVVKPVLGNDTDRFMPFLWTLFFFILICNLLGMLPVDSVAYFFGLGHVGGTPTGNVNITAGLALSAFVMIHVSGIREVIGQLMAGTYGHHHHDEDSHEAAGTGEPGEHHHGHGDPKAAQMAAPLAFVVALGVYMWNFAPHAFMVEHERPKPGPAKRLLMLVIFIPLLMVEMMGIGLLLGGAEAASVMKWIGLLLGFVYAVNASGLHPIDLADSLMWGFLFLLEVIGAIVKPFALCMRLFANMIAGHIVLASILLLFPVFKGLTAGYLAASLPIAIGGVLISCLELFVAFLQAYIFMFLTTMFISAAVHPQH